MEDANKKVDCYQCVHFAVTWEPRQPRACRLFGFKSPGLPSAVVFKSTGSVCQGFEQKKRHNGD